MVMQPPSTFVTPQPAPFSVEFPNGTRRPGRRNAAGVAPSTAVSPRRPSPRVHVLVAAVGARSRDSTPSLPRRREPVSGERSRRLAHAVRLGLVGRGVVAASARDGRAVALLGSQVYASRRPSSIRSSIVSRPDPTTMLDALGDDLVAIGADETSGTLTLAAGVGNHRLFTAEVDGGVMVASQLRAARRRARARPRCRPILRRLPPRLRVPAGRAHGVAGVRGLGAGTVRGFPAPSMVACCPCRDRQMSTSPTARQCARRCTRRSSRRWKITGPRRRHAVLLGGFDSALVAAGLRGLGHDVDCYTFGFGDPLRATQCGAARGRASVPRHAGCASRPS